MGITSQNHALVKSLPDPGGTDRSLVVIDPREVQARQPAPPAPAVQEWTEEQKELIKKLVCKGATDDELALFAHVCRRTGLDPFARQIYGIKRKERKGDTESVLTIQASIDGFRLVAERSQKYVGQIGPFWCGKDGKWVDAWLSSEPPAAARVGVLRDDFKEPLWAFARFSAYAQRYPDNNLKGLWKTMPELMIAKCAEALALRRAFPQELSGLYTADELDQIETGDEDQAPAPKAKSLPSKPKELETTKQEPPKQEAIEIFREIPEHIDKLIEFAKVQGLDPQRHNDVLIVLKEYCLNKPLRDVPNIIDDFKKIWRELGSIAEQNGVTVQKERERFFKLCKLALDRKPAQYPAMVQDWINGGLQ